MKRIEVNDRNWEIGINDTNLQDIVVNEEKGKVNVYGDKILYD